MSATRATLFGRHGHQANTHFDDSVRDMESNNNAAIIELTSQIDEITNIARGMKTELNQQNDLIRILDDKFQAARSALGGTMKNLGVLASSSNPRHLWALAGFVILFVGLIWFMAR